MKSSVFLNVLLLSFRNDSYTWITCGSVSASVFICAFLGGPAYPVLAVADDDEPGVQTTESRSVTVLAAGSPDSGRRPGHAASGGSREISLLTPFGPWRPQASLACGYIAPTSVFCPVACSSSVWNTGTFHGFKLQTGGLIRCTLQ